MEIIFLVQLAFALLLIIIYVVIDYPSCPHTEALEVPADVFDSEGKVIYTSVLRVCKRCGHRL